jgi:hypothetical protein
LTPSFTQYTEVKEQAKLEWMIEMFHIAKEYRSPSRLNILLLVWDMITFLYNRTEVETRMKKLIEKPGIGFFGWWDDIRFKFRKFQYGDLPAVDVTETIAETLADMNVVQLQLHQAKESTTCDVERVSDPASTEIRRASSDDEAFQRTLSIPVTRAASTIMRTASASDTSWVSLRPFHPVSAAECIALIPLVVREMAVRQAARTYPVELGLAAVETSAACRVIPHAPGAKRSGASRGRRRLSRANVKPRCL